VSADPSQLSTPEPPAQLTSREVLRSPDVRAMLVYGTCLYTGLMLQAAVLGKQVYDITGREIDIGWIGLVEFLPAAVLVLVTGVVADRFYRRNVVLVAVAGELISAVALMFYARTNPTAYGIARAFVAPAAR
jgi:MFS family permease